MKRAFAMIVALVVATPRIAGAGEPGPADAPPLEQVEQDLERRNADLDARLGAEATRTRERLDLDVQRSLVDQKTREEADRRVPGELRVEQARRRGCFFSNFTLMEELGCASDEACAATTYGGSGGFCSPTCGPSHPCPDGLYCGSLGHCEVCAATAGCRSDASNRCCAVNAAQKVLGCIPDVNVKEDTAFTEVGARCLAPPPTLDASVNTDASADGRDGSSDVRDAAADTGQDAQPDAGGRGGAGGTGGIAGRGARDAAGATDETCAARRGALRRQLPAQVQVRRLRAQEGLQPHRLPAVLRVTPLTCAIVTFSGRSVVSATAARQESRLRIRRSLTRAPDDVNAASWLPSQGDQP